MIVIFIDYLSKRLITISVRDTITARELASLFLEHVVRHIRVPKTIISDRGSQFMSNF
jgi:hypothetical protein